MLASLPYHFRRFSLSRLQKLDIAAFVFLLFGITLRFIHAFTGKSIDQEIWSDMNGYVYIAEQVLQNKWEPFHFFQSIGYPLLIAGVKYLFTDWGLVLGLLQATLSSLTLFIMYELAKRTLGQRVALLSLAIGAIHLPWILAIGYALAETVFSLFLASCAWFSYLLVYTDKNRGRNAVGWILSFIFAFWMKGTIVFYGPLFVVGLLVLKRRWAIVPVIIISSLMSFALLGHGLLTYEKIGKFQMTSSAGGLNFVEGKCPAKINKDSQGYSWLSPLYYQLRMEKTKHWDRPFTDSQYYMGQGWKCIREEPKMLLLSLESIPLLFFGNTTWPFNQKPYSSEVRFYELLLAIFFIVGLANVIKVIGERQFSARNFIIWCLPALGLFVCVYIFKSEVRFRFPYDLWFIPLSAFGWFQFLRVRLSPE